MQQTFFSHKKWCKEYSNCWELISNILWYYSLGFVANPVRMPLTKHRMAPVMDKPKDQDRV